MQTTRFVWQRLLVILFLLTSPVAVLKAQIRAGLPTAPPDGSAALDVSGGPYPSGSEYRGIAPPKVALSKTSVSTPVTKPVVGLLVYNTSTTEDLTPGYYYWEGSHWLRFNTVTNTKAGGARVAAVNGQSIPAYLISQVSGLTTDIIYIADEGREGMFRYVSGSTATVDGAITLTAGSGRYKRIVDGSVSVRWFGAKGDGTTDDTQAIQATIDYVKGTFVENAPTIKKCVFLPSGTYIITNALNCTMAPGLCIKGEGSRYFNTVIKGRTRLTNGTGGLMIDMTGSTLSGLENLYLSSQNGDTNPSSIGVQFALSKNPTTGVQNGGLNCYLKNVNITLANLPTANANLGSIAILNCRSEEWAGDNVYMQANTAVVATNTHTLQTFTGYNYTVSSPFASVQTDNNGSMGVMTFIGQCSVKQYETNTPAFLLNGTNNFTFTGYTGRVAITPESTQNYEYVIRTCQYTRGLKFYATVESFSGVIDIQNQLTDSEITTVFGLQHAPTTNYISLAGNENSFIENCIFNIASQDVANRYLLYSSEWNGGNDPKFGHISNSSINCAAWSDNTKAISKGILKQTSNTRFLTKYAFDVLDGTVVQKWNVKAQAGTLGNATSAILAQFQAADNQNRSFQNGGSYSIRVSGTVSVGSKSSGFYAIARFEGWIQYGQNYNRSSRQTSQNVSITNNLTLSSSNIAITGIQLSLDTSDPNVYKINALPTVTGSSTGEQITFDTKCELTTNFYTNGSALY